MFWLLYIVIVIGPKEQNKGKLLVAGRITLYAHYTNYNRGESKGMSCLWFKGNKTWKTEG